MKYIQDEVEEQKLWKFLYFLASSHFLVNYKNYFNIKWPILLNRIWVSIPTAMMKLNPTDGSKSSSAKKNWHQNNLVPEDEDQTTSYLTIHVNEREHRNFKSCRAIVEIENLFIFASAPDENPADVKIRQLSIYDEAGDAERNEKSSHIRGIDIEKEILILKNFNVLKRRIKSDENNNGSIDEIIKIIKDNNKDIIQKHYVASKGLIFSPSNQDFDTKIHKYLKMCKEQCGQQLAACAAKEGKSGDEMLSYMRKTYEEGVDIGYLA